MKHRFTAYILIVTSFTLLSFSCAKPERPTKADSVLTVLGSLKRAGIPGYLESLEKGSHRSVLPRSFPPKKARFNSFPRSRSPIP